VTGPYGLVVATGIGLAAAVIWRLAPRMRVDRLCMMDVVFWAVVGGIIGARLLFVVVEWRHFHLLCVSPETVLPPGVACSTHADCYPGQACSAGWCRAVGDCLAAFKFWQGGWVWLGGVLGGVPAGLLAARLRGLVPLRALALLSVTLPLGHAVGRVGCFMQGCCYGRTGSGLLAVGGRYPIQLFEAAWELLVLALLVAWFLRLAKREETGPTDLLSLPVLYFTLYSPFRIIAEVFRGDFHRGFVTQVRCPSLARALGISVHEPLFLSTSQAICLVLLGAALVFWSVRAISRRRPRTAPGGSSPAP